MTILVVGYNAFDVTVAVDGLPAADTKLAVAQIRFGGGGPAATAAVALARLGANVRLVTVLGDDLGAQWQRRELEAAGVDISRCQEAAGHAGARAVILVDPCREARTVLWTRGSLPQLDPAVMDPTWLEGCDLMLCDGHECAAAAVLAAAARGRGLPVVLDGGTVRDGVGRLVALCTDVISSRGFAPELTGEPDPRDALRALRAMGPEHVAITCGAGGCFALAGGELVHVPAFAVPVVDTTGAGDAFHGGYAFALARKAAWLDALEFGAAVAALKCGGWGGRSALPDLAAVERLVSQANRRTQVLPP